MSLRYAPASSWDAAIASRTLRFAWFFATSSSTAALRFLTKRLMSRTSLSPSENVMLWRIAADPMVENRIVASILAGPNLASISTEPEIQ